MVSSAASSPPVGWVDPEWTCASTYGLTVKCAGTLSLCWRGEVNESAALGATAVIVQYSDACCVEAFPAEQLA